MENKEYQQKARATAIYPGVGELKNGNIASLTYLALGLNGEAGEVAEKVKKLLRDKNGVMDEEFKTALLKEVSDCLWYCSNICDEFEATLGDVMDINIEKLYSRKDRGKLTGNGDER